MEAPHNIESLRVSREETFHTAGCIRKPKAVIIIFSNKYFIYIQKAVISKGVKTANPGIDPPTLASSFLSVTNPAKE